VTSLLPWPGAYLGSRRWTGVRRLLDRLLGLARDGAVPGTILLLGEPGLGREAVAVELACLLICRAPEGVPCACRSCDRVRRGIHPDLTVVDIEVDEKTGRRRKEISIEQARTVADGAAALPFEGRRRVVVFVSAHTPPLNTHAASALLKTLEEPPPHTCFVLLAANPARVLPTVVSRAVQLRVPRPDHGELVDLLAAVHGIAVAEAEAHWRACAEDAVVALRLEPGNAAGVLRGLAELAGEAVDGDPLAALRLAVRARAGAELSGLLARVLAAEAGRRDADGSERALAAAAALLAAERRRAALHLDAESVTAGALLPLLAAGGV
jgi:hypothetical protein